MHVGRRERKQKTSNDTNYHVKGDAGMREEQRDVRSLEMRDTSSTERLKKEPPGGVFQHGWIIFICHNRHTPHYLWARDWMVTSFCSVSLESFRAHVAFHKKKRKTSLRQQCEKSPPFPPLFLHASQIHNSATISLVNSIPEPDLTEEELRVGSANVRGVTLIRYIGIIWLGALQREMGWWCVGCSY